jgi:putative addiction module killer protein
MMVERLDKYASWVRSLNDARAKAKISVRVDRLVLGNPGDVRPVGNGVSEMRIDYGPGYRVYFGQHGGRLIILLCGGAKKTQASDITEAKRLYADWKKGK